MATPKKDPKDHLPKGRPSKYDVSMCETVVSCMKKGYIVEEVCTELGIHRDTFFEWIKIYPDFSDCYKKGKSAFNSFWTRAFKSVMLGVPLTKPKKNEPARKTSKGNQKNVDDDDDPNKAENWGKANPAMMIFYMKVHCGWKETVRVRSKVKGSLTIDADTEKKLSDIFHRKNGQKDTRNNKR